MIGQTLAHYKILEKIGSGGMGDVYLAEDNKLDRKVALKVLPPELAENEERRARFQREAKAIAALDHPNIVQVFSVEESDGIHFITMQLVQGKTLTELLPRNGFPLNTFFEIAIPLADAVAAAHQEGITHRDLKPDNVMVGDDGRVKVLDFGLAKATAGLASGAASEQLTLAKTEEGAIVGTLSYMSPEQAEGKPVDHRSDIFSLGIVIYEMVSGERPFRGSSAAAVLASILREVPVSLTATRPELPRNLDKLVQRCLVKNVEDRLQAARDLRIELQELEDELAADPAFLTSQRRPSKSWRVLGALALLLAATALGLFLSKARRAPDILRLANPVKVTSGAGLEVWPTWSPAGSRMAFQSDEAGNWDVWVTEVGSGNPVNRTGDHDGFDVQPAWSPNGRYIAFRSSRDGGGVFIVPSLSGPARRVSRPETRTRGAPQWSADSDELAYAVRESDGWAIEIAALETSGFRRMKLPAETRNCRDLSWSPDGIFFAYLDAESFSDDNPPLRLISSIDNSARLVTDSFRRLRGPAWSHDGKSLYFVGDAGGSADLYQQQIGEHGSVDGSPVAISAGVGMGDVVAMSRDGSKLAYSKAGRTSGVWRVPHNLGRPATWADAQPLISDESDIEFVNVSPGGDRLLVTSDRSGNAELWSYSIEGGEMLQLTDHPASDNDGVWSPDGKQVAFYSTREGDRDIWVMPANGGPARRLTDSREEDYGPTWSPDGESIAFERNALIPINGIFVVPTSGGAARRIASDPEYLLEWSAWSPDGQWIAYGKRGEDLWRVAIDGGTPERLADSGNRPQWSSDGQQIFYYYSEDGPRSIRALTLSDRSDRVVAVFEGRPGRLRGENFSVHEDQLFFIWRENRSDIWVMDVVMDEDS